MNMENKSQAGKGDKPRNCFSRKYRDNFDSINWNKNIKKIPDKQANAAILDITIQNYSVCYDENGIEIHND